MSKIKPSTVTVIPTDWQDIILVCRKCSKKLDGGFGPKGDDSLGQALKHTLRQTGRRRTVRVIETKCLSLCPRGAVTMLRASHPGAMLAVPAGTDAGMLLDDAVSRTPAALQPAIMELLD